MFARVLKIPPWDIGRLSREQFHQAIYLFDEMIENSK
jgi:hypothetical protein